MRQVGVVVICLANICRSPIGEALLAREVADRGLEDQVRVSSGGFLENGREAHPFSIQVMKRRGVDIRAHQSRILTPMIISKNDLILAMTEDLANQARRLGAEHAYSIRPYATLGKSVEDIPDPIGMSLPVFQECAESLEALMPLALDRILQEKF